MHVFMLCAYEERPVAIAFEEGGKLGISHRR
jgi:hypothetical protein